MSSFYRLDERRGEMTSEKFYFIFLNWDKTSLKKREIKTMREKERNSKETKIFFPSLSLLIFLSHSLFWFNLLLSIYLFFAHFISLPHSSSLFQFFSLFPSLFPPLSLSLFSNLFFSSYFSQLVKCASWGNANKFLCTIK